MSDHAALAPLERHGGSVHEEIVARLRALILAGVLKPGDRLATERELAEQLVVSRSAVREALLRLQSAGLVERRQGSGTRVSARVPISAALASWGDDEQTSIAAASEFRTVVEPQIARLAATRIDDAQLDELEAVVVESSTVLDGQRSVQLDIAFHAGVAAATRNPLLASLSELTVSWTLEARLFSHVAADGRRLSHEGHARVLRALRAANPDAAEAAMRVHLDEIADLAQRVRD
ncbi:GntR family transcriptional repressor for pyruvate dehydrogenase complex [Microbacterium testaceum]|uniref:FadR/GntR family transcriptional regulator n=1 Tax=Microbacterium TaxID=33882 RepID=UPI002782E3A6|nr:MULTISPECIES: FCD domain-containing protein [Microbacterium]MDQ1112475.1 GntR family transcriptional repressor for pyruvate dehydrogenase complex [Microbacterium testaceum]MDR6096988.1 GntR family transcriptional repressor for pyruvate dehydrogenase complex [Microbacterium sp. SORGH_AS_0454]